MIIQLVRTDQQTATNHLQWHIQQWCSISPTVMYIPIQIHSYVSNIQHWQVRSQLPILHNTKDFLLPNSLSYMWNSNHKRKIFHCVRNFIDNHLFGDWIQFKGISRCFTKKSFNVCLIDEVVFFKQKLSTTKYFLNTKLCIYLFHDMHNDHKKHCFQVKLKLSFSISFNTSVHGPWFLHKCGWLTKCPLILVKFLT